MLSVANARYGDVQYIVTVALGALYFLTPILYPLSLVEDTASWLAIFVQANPMSWFVEAMHGAMYSLQAPDWWMVPALLALGVLTFWLGLVVIERKGEDLREWL